MDMASEERPTKRRRLSQDSAADVALLADADDEDLPLPTDTEAALDLLRTQCPQVELEPSIVLKSQIYSIVQDGTVVDRELDALMRSGQLRVFKLFSSRDDYAILRTTEYIHQISLAKQRTFRNGTKGEHLAVTSIFDRFSERVVPTCTDVCISKDTLVELVHGSGKALKKIPKPVVERSITKLVNGGLLGVRDVNSFWLKVPYTGSFLKQIEKGRNEVSSIIKRQHFKEILLKNLETKRLRYSKLDIRFHVRDMIGLGLVERVDSTSGPVIKLTRR